MPSPISPNLFNTLPSAAPGAARPLSAEAAADVARLAAPQPSFRESLNQLRQKRREAAAAPAEHGARARAGKAARSSGPKRNGSRKPAGATSNDGPSAAGESEPVTQDAAAEGEGRTDHAESRDGPVADSPANPEAGKVAEAGDAGPGDVEGSADAETADDSAAAGDDAAGPVEAQPSDTDEDRTPDRAADGEHAAAAAPIFSGDPSLAAALQGAGGAAATASPTDAPPARGVHSNPESADDASVAGRQRGKPAVTPLAGGPRGSDRAASHAGSADQQRGGGAEQAGDATAAAAPPAAAAPAPGDGGGAAADDAAPAAADPATAAAAPPPGTDQLGRFASRLAEAAGGSSPSHATTGPFSTDAPDAPAPPEVRFASTNHPSIVRSIRQELLPNGGTMRLRLDPAELGAIQVTVRMQDGAMTASFETSSDHATSLLSHSLGQLKAALESQGVQVDRLHVQQSPREQSTSQQQQQGGEQQRDGNPHDHPARQEQQRRELLRRMWRRMSGGQDPLDLVA